MMKKIKGVMKKQIKEHRQKFDPDNLRDFIDVFLEGERHEQSNIVYSGKQTKNMQLLLNLMHPSANYICLFCNIKVQFTEYCVLSFWNLLHKCEWFWKHPTESIFYWSWQFWCKIL